MLDYGKYDGMEVLMVNMMIWNYLNMVNMVIWHVELWEISWY